MPIPWYLTVRENISSLTPELDVRRLTIADTSVQTFNGKKWEKFNSEKVASLAYARIQGRNALIAHFQNSSLMNEEKWCRPMLFHKDGPNAGDQVRVIILLSALAVPPCLCNDWRRVASVLIRNHSLWVTMFVLGPGGTDHLAVVRRLPKRQVHQPLLTEEKPAPDIPTQDRQAVFAH